MSTRYFEFTQNNSGGFFDVDDNVCHRVIIEANDEDEAKRIFEPMIEGQSYSCECCGDRWSSYSPDEINLSGFKEKGYPVGVYSHYPDAEERWQKLYGNFQTIEPPSWQEKYGSREFMGKVYFNSIEEYCQFMANTYGWTSPDIRIHYKNGAKKEIFKSDI